MGLVFRSGVVAAAVVQQLILVGGIFRLIFLQQVMLPYLDLGSVKVLHHGGLISMVIKEGS